MKKYLIGALAGLLIYPVVADIAELVDDKFETNYWIKVGIPSYGLTLGLTGRCTNHIRPSGVSNRHYFGCGKLNVLISNLLHGEVK